MDLVNLIFEILFFIDKNILFVILGIIIYYLIFSISFYSILKKIDKMENKNVLPIFNIVSILELSNLPKYMAILFLVPYVNILGMILGGMYVNYFFACKINLKLIEKFLLIFLPIIGFPIVASKKSLSYIGNDLSIENIEGDITEDIDNVVTDVPKYEISSLNDSDLKTISVTEFLTHTNDESLTIPQLNESKDDVSDITFDYNNLYSKSNNQIMNIDEMMKNSDEVKDVNMSENVLNVMDEDAKIDDFMISTKINEPIQSSDSLIMGVSLDEKPQVDVPAVESITEVPPVVEAQVINPITEVQPVLETPIVEQPTEVVQTEIPNVEVPNIDIPQVDIPVVEPITEVPPVVEAQVIDPIIEAQPVVETSVVEQPTEVAQNNEPTENDEDEIGAPQVDIPIIDGIVEDVVPDIYSNDELEKKLIDKDNNNEDDKNNELLKNSKDGFTLDYNSIYNIQSENEINSNVTSDQDKTSDSSNIEDSINNLSIAKPPSFDVEEDKKEEVIVEDVIEDEPQTSENLISIDIDEPGSLPVAHSIKQNTNNNDSKNLNINNDIQMNNIQQPARPMNNMQQSISRVNDVSNKQVIRNPYNNVQRVNSNMNPRNNSVNNRNLNTNSRFINNDNSKYTLPRQEKAVINKPTDPNLLSNPLSIFGNSNGNVLRPTSNEAMRYPNNNQRNMGPRIPQQRSNQGNMGPRGPQQRPIQGNIGPRGPQQRPNQNRGLVCPKCGLPVKPGQPICLMCGTDLK